MQWNVWSKCLFSPSVRNSYTCSTASIRFSNIHSPTKPFSGLPLKSQDKNSQLLQNFSGPEIPKNQHPFLYRFWPWPMNLVAKQDIAKLEMQWNWKFNSKICFIAHTNHTTAMQLTCWPNWFFSTIVIKYHHFFRIFFRTNAQFQDFSGPDFSSVIFQDFSGPMGTLLSFDFTPNHFKHSTIHRHRYARNTNFLLIHEHPSVVSLDKIEMRKTLLDSQQWTNGERAMKWPQLKQCDMNINTLLKNTIFTTTDTPFNVTRNFSRAVEPNSVQAPTVTPVDLADHLLS